MSIVLEGILHKFAQFSIIDWNISIRLAGRQFVMPRNQERLRALRRLTNRLNDLLFNREFIDTVIDMRARLGIDIDRLKHIARDSLAERGLANDKGTWSAFNAAYARVDALVQHLVVRRLISQYSAKALRLLKIYSGGGRFWKIVGEAYKLDLPDSFAFVPYECVVGGLCFDITEYSRQYEKAEFCDVTNRLLEVTKGKYIFDKLPVAGLEEYLLFCMYVRLAIIGSRLIYFERGFFWDDEKRKIKERGVPFRTIDTWRKYISSYINEFSVYLDVSDLSLDDIGLYWGQIQMAKEIVGAYEWLPRGRRKGIKQSRKSGLGNLTWQQIREQIREQPKDLNKLWNEYVSKLGRQNPVMRRRAIQNFYKQVIVHPDMLDLKLQTRKRGRPRKN